MANKISGIDGRPVQVGGSAPTSRVRDAASEGKKAAETTGPVSKSAHPARPWPMRRQTSVYASRT